MPGGCRSSLMPCFPSNTPLRRFSGCGKTGTRESCCWRGGLRDSRSGRLGPLASNPRGPIVMQPPVGDPLMSISSRRLDAPSAVEPEPLLRELMDGILDAFILIDARGMIRFWNRRAEAMFGWSEAEILGSALQDTIIP